MFTAVATADRNHQGRLYLSIGNTVDSVNYFKKKIKIKCRR
jgi:hypothetical protein